MDQIRKIYYNLDSLIDIYKDLPETEASFTAMDDYVQSLGIFENEEMKHHKRKLYNLISNLGDGYERQSFLDTYHPQNNQRIFLKWNIPF